MFFQSHIFCCTNRREPGATRGCCAEKNAEALRDYLKARVKALGLPKVRVNTAGCLDRCELGPCMVIYPEGTWYACKSEPDIDEMLAAHVIGDGRAERLMLPGSD